MRRIYLTLALATAPVIALALGLFGIGHAAFETAAARLLAGGWVAAAVLFACVGPLIALVLYRHHRMQTETAQQRAPAMKRPAIDSGPFGRLIE
jgi:membrane protein implicated in regulation of membrane protease activity